MIPSEALISRLERRGTYSRASLVIEGFAMSALYRLPTVQGTAFDLEEV